MILSGHLGATTTLERQISGKNVDLDIIMARILQLHIFQARISAIWLEVRQQCPHFDASAKSVCRRSKGQIALFAGNPHLLRIR